MFVLQMSPAKREPCSSATSFASCERLAVERLEQVLLADDLQLLAVAVVGERLDDVGSRPRELDVQLADDVGVLEHDLGHEAAGLEIPPPLELEEVALGADDRAGLEAARADRLRPPSVRRRDSVSVRHGRPF